MKRCLKMLININQWETKWGSEIQAQALKLRIEGVMQTIEQDQIRIMICGEDSDLDDFVDFLYDFFLARKMQIEELEPFIKDRDYRGVFRVI